MKLNLLPGDNVFVAYEWIWLTDDFDNDGDGTQMAEDDAEENAEDSDDCVHVSHTVTFKCIGANRNPNHQTALEAAADDISNGKNVPVRLFHEPNNPNDSMAMAFECLLDGQWKRIGYVIKEVLQEVHEASRSNVILSVNFEWVKFLLCWSRSGPGFYAGINISKRGTWSRTVTRFASTK